MKIYIVIAALWLGLSAVWNPAESQELYRLDLETSILLAKQKSIAMRQLNERVRMASLTLKQALSTQRTRATLGLQLPNYNETVQQWVDTTGVYFYPIRQSTMGATLNIRQPLPTDGQIYITARGTTMNDYYPNERSTQLTSSIGLTQPIGALFGINNNRMNVKQARLSYELNQKSLKRAELNNIYMISRQFYSLLQEQERVKISKQNLENQQEAFDVTRRKFEAGLVGEIQALQNEVDLSQAQNDYDMAQLAFSNQVSNFKESLGINLSDSIVLIADLSYQEVPVDVNKALELAFMNRPEIREQEIQIEMQEMNIRRVRAQGLISGDLTFNYNFVGVGKDPMTLPLDANFESAWNHLTSRPGNFGVGITASIPLIDWGSNKSQLELARSQQRLNYLSREETRKSLEKEIRSTVDQLNSSLRSIKLLEKSIPIAEKSYEISRQRFANGEIDNLNMSQERNRINGVYTKRLDAFISYKLLLIDLMTRTFYDFEKGKSVE